MGGVLGSASEYGLEGGSLVGGGDWCSFQLSDEELKGGFELRCLGLLSTDRSGLLGCGSERSERRVREGRGRIFWSPMLDKAAAAKAKMPPDLGLLVMDPTEGWLECCWRGLACSTDETEGRVVLVVVVLKASLRGSLVVGDDASWMAGGRDA